MIKLQEAKMKAIFTRTIALLMVLLLAMTSFTACIVPNDGEGDEEKMLDGKKVIFIGNSFIHYGHTVLPIGQEYLTQESRVGDKGFFYQLCLENGENVEVTNFCFGGHRLRHFYSGSCAADRGCDGVDHFSYITDKYYDYVCISASGSEECEENFMADMEYMMNFFKEANPNVKFVYLNHHYAHGISSSSGRRVQTKILADLKTLEEMGVIIVDWGRIVKDCIDAGKIEGGSMVCDQNTFVIRKSESDGYHENQLSGYITAVMTYCAITGKRAVDMPYEFCGNHIVNESYNSLKYILKNYTYNGATTNYTEILKSEEEMTALRKMIDKYLEEKPYLNYTE